MSDKKTINEGYRPIEKGNRPSPSKDKGGAVTGGYQPERSQGTNPTPTQSPAPPKKD